MFGRKFVFSQEPCIIGQYEVKCDEMMFVQDMLIALPGQPVMLPERLKCFSELVEEVVAVGRPKGTYLYLSAKRLFVSPTCSWNRPGWHIDGFGTEDINYLWSDSFPTEFCVGQDFDLSDDHILSMQQMTEQVRSENVVTYDNNLLLQLTNTIVHQVAPVTACGVRTFAKISVSLNKYNLIGNARNELIDYHWNMVNRDFNRNDPSSK